MNGAVPRPANDRADGSVLDARLRGNLVGHLGVGGQHPQGGRMVSSLQFARTFSRRSSFIDGRSREAAFILLKLPSSMSMPQGKVPTIPGALNGDNPIGRAALIGSSPASP
jgi:hypothetical protein